MVINGIRTTKGRGLARILVEGLMHDLQVGADAADRMASGEALDGDEKRLQVAEDISRRMAEYFKPERAESEV